MRRGRYEAKRKHFPFFPILVALLLIAAISSAGAAAYLAKASDAAVENKVTADQPPKPQIVLDEEKYYVDVGNPGYAVYVRVALIPNWKHNDEVIPASPDEFTFDLGEDWVLHSDGFCYYTKPIHTGRTSEIYTAIHWTQTRNGSLDVDVSAQVIQALGTTDAQDPQTAVFDAWGVQPEALPAAP